MCWSLRTIFIMAAANPPTTDLIELMDTDHFSKDRVDMENFELIRVLGKGGERRGIDSESKQMRLTGYCLQLTGKYFW